MELAPTAAARERIIDMFSMVVMSELYEIVEAVVAAACATPEGVRAIKATGRELGASVPTEKESAVVRAGALIEGVDAVCASVRAALRASALFGHGGAAVLEVLAVPPSAAKMMKDLRDEAETHERRGDVGARDAERAVRRLARVVVRLEDRFRRAALVISRARDAFARLTVTDPTETARDRDLLHAAFSGNTEAITAVDDAYACCIDGRRGLVQLVTKALTACLSDDEGTVKAALAAVGVFDIRWLHATFSGATGAATDAIRAFRAARSACDDLGALFVDVAGADGVAVGLAATTDAAFDKVRRSLVAALTAVAGGDCRGSSSHFYAADEALQDLQRLRDSLARAATGAASDSSSHRVLVEALVREPSPDAGDFVCDWETERPVVVPPPPPDLSRRRPWCHGPRPWRQECPRPAALRPRSPRAAAPLPNMNFMRYVPDESDIDFPAFDILEDFKTAKPLTFDEKRGLCDDIDALPPDKLAHVAKTVQESFLLRVCPDDDEVDIETLDNDTLRYLQKYVKASLMNTFRSIGLRKLREVLVSKEGYATVDLAGWSSQQYGCGGNWYFRAPEQRRQMRGIKEAVKHYKATHDLPPGAAPVVAPPTAAITPATLPPSSASAPPCASAPFVMPPSPPPRPAPFNDSSNLNPNSPPA